MPTLGGEGDDGDTKYGTSWFGSSIEVDSSAHGPNDLYVTSLVPDQSSWPFAGSADVHQETLRDFTEGQDWLLKRIVGRLNVGVEQVGGTEATTPAFITVGAGFYVGRARDDQQESPDATLEEIDPLSSKNIRQPWIWRRTWQLRNQLVPGPITGSADNMLHGGAAEGPVIDTKIARRIRREERLWFVLNGYGAPDLSTGGPAGGYPTKGIVHFGLDYRILGAMRRSTNRSVF